MDGFHFLYSFLLYLIYTDFSIHKGVVMNHRIAILSDIHGDTTALEAVIADARALGTQYLMEGLDPKRIDWLRSLPLVGKKEVNGIRFSLSHNLPEKNYGGDLRPANATENFDQLLDDQTDMAIYGHVHKQLLRYGSQGQQILNPGTIGMPYFDWEPIQNHRAQYALIDVEEDGVTNLQFRKVAYDYEAELQDAKDKDLPYIELYEELRREDNYPGHNSELLASLNEKYNYAKVVAAYFDLSNES